MLYQQPQSGPLDTDPAYRATFTYNAGTNTDAIGSAVALVGAPVRVTGPQGVGFRFDTSAKYINVTPRTPQTLTSFNFVYSFTQLGSVINGGTILKMVGTSGNSNKIDIYTLSNGQIQADVYNSAGTATTVATAAGAVVAGGVYSIGLEFDGATLLWRVNGQRSGSAQTFSGSRNAEAPTFTLGGTTTASASANHDILFAAFAKYRGPELTTNPWQLFLDPDEDDEAAFFAAGGAGFTVTFDGTLATEWASAMLRDAVMRGEWTAPLQRDSVWPTEFGAAVRADAPAPAGITASVQFDRAAPAEWIAPVRADALASADWTSNVISSSAVQVELAMQVRADSALPMEWAGTLSVTADSLVPLEWRTTLSMDARGVAEWLGLTRVDTAVPADLGAQRAIDGQMPVVLMAGLQVDGVALADWTGGVAINSDGRMPLEWLGGVLVTANAVLPLEFGAVRAVDATLQASWSSAFIADRQIPASFKMGLIANQQGALDWLRSVFGDAVLPGETLVVITGSAGAPLEFGGASSFVPGNTEIFRIDARGYIWRVDARSTIWLPASR